MGIVWELGSYLFCFFDGHAPFSGFALKNKGVPIMLSYFKTTGSRLLPASPKRGHYTRQEKLPWRPQPLTPERMRPRVLCQHQAQAPASSQSYCTLLISLRAGLGSYPGVSFLACLMPRPQVGSITTLQGSYCVCWGMSKFLEAVGQRELLTRGMHSGTGPSLRKGCPSQCQP